MLGKPLDAEAPYLAFWILADAQQDLKCPLLQQLMLGLDYCIVRLC